MNATAGFDVVFEIGPSALKDAIRANLRLGGVQMNPPFEMRNPFSNIPLIGSGNSYTIVYGMDVSIEGASGVRISLSFDNSCIENDDPGGFSVYGLKGTASILLQLLLVQDTPLSRTIGFDPTAADVSLQFADTSRTAITNALNAVGLGALGWQLLETQGSQALKDRIATQSPKLPGFSFPIIPGTPGGLAPSLQFERLELHNVGTVAVGIFGSCRPIDHNAGDPSQKSIVPLPPGQNVRMTISAAAFHNLAFCPSMASQLRANIPDLPSSCGGGDSVGFGPGSLSRMEDRFEPGAIVISGTVTKSGTCYDASMTFEVRFPIGLDSHGAVVVGTAQPTFGEPRCRLRLVL